jgi:hypothetical protein
MEETSDRIMDDRTWPETHTHYSLGANSRDDKNKATKEESSVNVVCHG